MSWKRAMALLMTLTLPMSACGDDGGDTAARDTASSISTTEAPPAAAACPGTEIGDVPLTVEVPEDGPYEEPADLEPLGVATGPDGVVYVNLQFSVYCISDDTVFEVATPETLPYPEGEEESSYADIAVSPDGNPLVVDWRNPRVFEIVDGEATVVPGSDDPMIGGSRSIDVGPDGTIYVTGLDESGSNNVYAIADGGARLYAGSGRSGTAGDGGPATESSLSEPEGLHVGPDGNLYIADRNNGRVAVVDPDGTIDTLLGGRFFDDRPDSDALEGPHDVATDPSGVVHVFDTEGDAHGLLRVEEDGTATLLSSKEYSDCFPHFTPSESVTCALDQLELDSVYRMAFDATGALWMTERSELLRAVDGRVETAIEFEFA